MTGSVVVLVVEDEETIRDVLEYALADGGLAVVLATTSEEAMAKLHAEGADYSGLVTDINLPGKFSGWDLARHAREINDTLPVVYMSGSSAHEWASQGISNSQITPKPFAVAQLVTAVTQLINAAANMLAGKA